MRIRLLAAAALALGLSQPAQSAVLYAFEENGAGVFGTLSGTLDTTGVSFSAGFKGGININPSGSSVLSGADGNAGINFTAFAAPVPAFGTGGLTNATATTGDLFAILGTTLGLPSGYVSGTALSGTLDFTGATFASLGITPGSYDYILPNDTVTLSFTTAVIPLPATLPLMLGALALGGLVARRRRPA